MTIHVERSALMPYSASKMFILVNDAARYPEFLPWCSSTDIISSTGTEMVARLNIAKGPIKQYFVTKNILVTDKSITIDLQEGPFKHLKGLWTFEALDENACKVTLSMDFDYSNIILKATLGPLFNKAASTMVDLFCQRARAIYG